jgi:hypothetical protein
MRFFLLTLLGLVLAGRPALAADGDLGVTVLGTGQAVFGDQVWPYQLLRLQEPERSTRPRSFATFSRWGCLPELRHPRAAALRAMPPTTRWWKGRMTLKYTGPAQFR